MKPNYYQLRYLIAIVFLCPLHMSAGQPSINVPNLGEQKHALPASLQLLIHKEDIIATIRGDRLYEAVFLDETPKAKKIRKIIGLNDESKYLFNKYISQLSPKNKNLSAIIDELPMSELSKIQDLPAEEQAKIQENLIKMMSEFDGVCNDAMKRLLSEEQLCVAKKCYLAIPSEFVFANQGGIDIFCANYLDILDLSPEQATKIQEASQKAEKNFSEIVNDIYGSKMTEETLGIQVSKAKKCMETLKNEVFLYLNPKQEELFKSFVLETKTKIDGIQCCACPTGAPVPVCPCPTTDRRPENGGGNAETGEKMNDKIDNNSTEKGETEK